MCSLIPFTLSKSKPDRNYTRGHNQKRAHTQPRHHNNKNIKIIGCRRRKHVKVKPPGRETQRRRENSWRDYNLKIIAQLWLRQHLLRRPGAPGWRSRSRPNTSSTLNFDETCYFSAQLSKFLQCTPAKELSILEERWARRRWPVPRRYVSPPSITLSMDRPWWPPLVLLVA